MHGLLTTLSICRTLWWQLAT